MIRHREAAEKAGSALARHRGIEADVRACRLTTPYRSVRRLRFLNAAARAGGWAFVVSVRGESSQHASVVDPADDVTFVIGDGDAGAVVVQQLGLAPILIT